MINQRYFMIHLTTGAKHCLKASPTSAEIMSLALQTRWTGEVIANTLRMHEPSRTIELRSPAYIMKMDAANK
jgi:hypothetical protein